MDYQIKVYTRNDLLSQYINLHACQIQHYQLRLSFSKLPTNTIGIFIEFDILLNVKWCLIYRPAGDYVTMNNMIKKMCNARYNFLNTKNFVFNRYSLITYEGS